MSLPSEIDFTADPEATPGRMDRAMAWLLAQIRVAQASAKTYEQVITELRGIGLARVAEALTPVFMEAQQVAANLAAIQAQWEDESLILANYYTMAQTDAAFAAIVHGHAMDDVAGLVTALAALMPRAGGIFSGDITISGVDPDVVFHDTGAAADEGKWRWHSDAVYIALQAINDAISGSINAYQIMRGAGLTIDRHVWYTGAAIEKMRLTNTGALGIGVNAPDEKLDVSGLARAKGFREVPANIADAAAFELNPANGGIQSIALGANRTPKATNFAEGASMVLVVTAGSYLLTLTDATFGAGGVVVVGDPIQLSTTGKTWLTFAKLGGQVYVWDCGSSA